MPLRRADTQDVDFVAFRPASNFDIKVSVDVPSDLVQFVSVEATPLEITQESKEEKGALTAPVSLPLPTARIVEFTTLPAGRYRIKLLSTLNNRQYTLRESTSTEVELREESQQVNLTVCLLCLLEFPFSFVCMTLPPLSVCR